MKLSMKWLADYTDVSEYSTKEYCDRMTATGSKVEGWEELGDDISGVVVGRVLEVAPHPDADKLVICKIDVGAADPLQQKPCGVEAHLLPRQLIGDVPFAALTGRVQKAVGQYAAHETADVFCSSVRAAEAGDQALFLRAVVIITECMANGLDTGFVHFFYKHDSASFLFHIP